LTSTHTPQPVRPAVSLVVIHSIPSVHNDLHHPLTKPSSFPSGSRMGNFLVPYAVSNRESTTSVYGNLQDVQSV
jgi:hypothetical protein